MALLQPQPDEETRHGPPEPQTLPGPLTGATAPATTHGSVVVVAAEDFGPVAGRNVVAARG